MCAVILFALTAACLSASTQSRLRKVRVGDKIEPFTLIEMDGSEFQYEHNPGRVSVFAFLAAHQKRSERALNDLLSIAADMRHFQYPVDLVVIITGGEGIDYFSEKRNEHSIDVPMLIDAEDALWGRMGIVVTPTTIMTDTKGAVRWVRAGHGYDFATDTQARLKLALGIDDVLESGASEPVHALANDSDEDRARRHLRMGQILARKGEVESGITELKNALALTPDAVDVQLELAQLLCRSAKPDEAIAVAEHITTVTREEQAQLKMVLGWAHRQSGDLDLALTLLTESIALDPRTGRTLFELGKLHEQLGDEAQALNAYRQALSVHYDEPAEQSSAPDGSGT